MKPRKKKTTQQKRKKLKIKEVFSLLVSILAITTGWVFFTWQRLQIVRLENRISVGLKTIREFEDNNRKLKLRRAAFRSLARITDQAERELGMTVMEKNQLVVLDKSWDHQR